MKKLNYLITFLMMWAGLLLIPLQAQINMPDLSPRCTFTQKIGFGEVTIDYSRPSMRGRTIFGDLVPFNELWRLGANEATAITFTEDVFINDHEVTKGMYLLFAIPGHDEWTFVLNKAYRLWGKYGYDQNKDVLRFKSKVEKLPIHVETFTIDIGEMTSTTGHVMVSWENTRVKFQIGTDADTRIVEEINKKLKNPTVVLGNTYFSAANYYLKTHRDIDQAMAWIDKAIEINGENGNYLNLKAQIYAEMDDYSKATQWAKKSIAKAKLEENEYLVDMNEELIEKWKNKLNQ
jgi:tetratricopeptide (TPR) repeat protein